MSPGMLSCFLAIALVADGAASGAWHLDGWQERAVVEIPQPLADNSVDTAAVRVVCQGRCQSEGADYRVVDSAGSAVPFQLMFHDPARYSLLAFRAADPRRPFFIYFGNPQAARAAEQVTADAAPGAGPPRGEWIPRHGLVYATVRRPEGENPKTVEELAAMLSASPATHGARYQRQISDGYNPFGSSDYYMSIYRGWMNIPQAGPYRFCTASNEASFSFLDGKALIHWPGRHTAERGVRGEKNALVELSAGWHYVEYYHEEVLLQQVAFLGWSPPGSPPGQFSAIPEGVFTAPHEAVVTRYENRAGPSLSFEPVIVDSIWPDARHIGQYTRCRFRVAGAAALGADATYRWDFGDGQTAAGAEVEHVYLAVGHYVVKLAAQGASVPLAAEWPLEIYEIQHVTEQIREGSPPEYVKLVESYDRGKLDAVALEELAHLLAESGSPAAALEVGNEFVDRFSATRPELLPGVRRLMADCAIQLGAGSLDEAVANYLASLTDATPPAERFEVLARLIRLLGIERDLPDKAAEIFAQAEEAAQNVRLDETTAAAFRKSIIAAGDVLLWHGQPDEAGDLYRRAEALTRRPIPREVRSAQVGAYPNLIREFMESGDHGAALDVVDRWENTFPTEKLGGQTFYWRGKLWALRGQHQQAARHLARAIGLAVGAGFESEARWLLAQSLAELGRTDDARRELAKLLASGFADEFAGLARKKLAQDAKDKKQD